MSLLLGSGDRSAAIDAGARALVENVRRRQFVGNTESSPEPDAELTRDNSIDTRALAGYVQARLQRGAFGLTPALRVERIDQVMRNRFPGSETEVRPTHTLLLPGAGATWQLTPNTMLFAGVHRGFAPPRPADLYSPAPGQSIVLVDPETSWNSEAGGRFSRNGMSIEATLFRMDFGNEIIEAPAATGQRFINGGKAAHAGIELSSQLRLRSLLDASTGSDLIISGSLMHLPIAERREATEATAVAGARLPYAPRNVASGSLTFIHYAAQ